MIDDRTTHRTTFTGIVVAAGRMARTITVAIARLPWHAKLKKQVRRSKWFLVDDPTGAAHVGDQVTIQETRPLSKRKHFRLVRVVSSDRNSAGS